MTMTARLRALACTLALIVTAALPARDAHAQIDDKWIVFMKSSPCAETLRDWMTVAFRNPSGGGNMFEQARPTNATTFPRTPPGFTAAHTMADGLRIGGFMGAAGFTRYENYCCRQYSVWEKNEAGKITKVVIRGMGNPGLGFMIQKSNLCCEEAGALAGSGGVCTMFRLANGQVVRFTDKGVEHLGVGPLVLAGLTIPAATDVPKNLCNYGAKETVGQHQHRTSVVFSQERPCRYYYFPTAKDTQVIGVQTVRVPANGTLTIGPVSGKPGWTYKSNPGFVGTDSFVVDVIQDRGVIKSTWTYDVSVI